MRLLVIIALATGCYDPELVACTVTCSSQVDCADGQACGTDGFCVAAAGDRCTGNPEKPDAATPTIALHVMVSGHGRVDIPGGGMCTSSCTYQLSPNQSVTATAVEIGDKSFQMWTSGCSGGSKTCTFTIAAAMQLGAKFE